MERSTAREALIAEALGDLGRLLDQTQQLVPALLDARQSMVDAHDRLARQVTEQRESFEAQLTQLSSRAKTQIVQHIALRGDDVAKRSIEQHVRAMDDAAHKLFVQELGPAMQRLILPLQRLQGVAQKAANPWNHWLTHAATAMAASIATWILTSGLWRP